MVGYLMTLPSFCITTNCLSKSVQNVLYSIAKKISLFVNHIQTDVIKYNYLFDNHCYNEDYTAYLEAAQDC